MASAYNILPTERYNHLEKSFVKQQTLQPCLLLSSVARLFQLLSAFREICSTQPIADCSQFDRLILTLVQLTHATIATIVIIVICVYQSQSGCWPCGCSLLHILCHTRRQPSRSQAALLSEHSLAF